MDEGAEDECDEQDGVCLDALVAHEDSDCSYTSGLAQADISKLC